MVARYSCRILTGKTSQIFVSFKVSKAYYWRSLVSWDVTPCCRVSGSRRFRGTCRLHLQGFKVHEECHKVQWRKYIGQSLTVQ